MVHKGSKFSFFKMSLITLKIRKMIETIMDYSAMLLSQVKIFSETTTIPGEFQTSFQ